LLQLLRTTIYKTAEQSEKQPTDLLDRYTEQLKSQPLNHLNVSSSLPPSAQKCIYVTVKLWNQLFHEITSKVV